MRLFIATDIDDATRAQLAAVRAAVQEVIGQARVPPRVTWTRDDAAHVTLRFIGETAEAVVPAIQEALSGGLGIAPFDVRWERVGTFGGRNPRVIWLAPTAGVDDFTRLAAAVNQRVDPLAGPAESRPFTPHLTLGRVKDGGRGVEWRRAIDAVRFTPTVARVDHVTLYQSRLSPKGSTYTSLCRVVL